ncbi:MAG TPA: hypothetical protein VGZ72_14530 [Stellaceae bacterium]|nr:hypothetical protein [Stellaceae bacterium]
MPIEADAGWEGRDAMTATPRLRARIAVLSVLATAALLWAPLAEAAPECVTPNSVSHPGKGLERVWIPVFERPDTQASPIWIKIASPLSLIVTRRQGGFLQLTTTESTESPFKPGIVLGWVRASDVQSEPYRNCAF